MRLFAAIVVLLLLSVSAYSQRLTNQRLYNLGPVFVENIKNLGYRQVGYINLGRYSVTGANRTIRFPNFFHLGTDLDSLNYTIIDSGSMSVIASYEKISDNRIFMLGMRYPQPFAFDMRINPSISIYDLSMRTKIREFQFGRIDFEDIFGNGKIFVDGPNKIWIYGTISDQQSNGLVPFSRQCDTVFNLTPITRIADTIGFNPHKLIKRNPNEYWLLGSQVYDTYTPGPNRFMAHGNKYVLDSNGQFLRKDIFDFRDDSRGMRYSLRGATGMSMQFHPMPDKSWLVVGGMVSNPNYPGILNDSLRFIARLDSGLRYTYWVQPIPNPGFVYVLDDGSYIRVDAAPWNPSTPNYLEIYRHDGATGLQLSSYSMTPVFNNLRPFPVYIIPDCYSFIGDSSILCIGRAYDNRVQPSPSLRNITGAFTIKGIPNHYNPVGLERKDQGSVKAVVRAYPNPFQGSFRVSPESPALYQQQGYIQLVNLNGQVVYEGPYQLGDELVLSNLPRGLYMYQFTSASGVCKGRVLRE